LNSKPLKLNVELEFAAKSHPGMVRSHNEDSITMAPECGLAILADGMGGYNAGEVASGMATAVLRNDLIGDLSEWYPELTRRGTAKLHTVLQARVTGANTAIYQSALSQPQYAGMGTTLAMALFRDRSVTTAHIGDSRIYRLRGEDYSQITRDHSLLQDQIDAGMVTPEQAKLSMNKNLVTRALGVDPTVEAEINDYETEFGDIYLLCSDGLSDMVPDAEVRETLQLLGSNLELAASTLIQQANDYGGRDNVSVILIKVQPSSKASRSLFTRFINWLK
jgi:serine/threonine protein phosphatase PrpC